MHLHTRLVSAACLLLLASGVAIARDGERGRRLSATLSGAQEVPAPGDRDGSGRATLRLHPGREEVCYKLSTRLVDSPTAAHVHRGARGMAGPAVVTLKAPREGASQGCVGVERDLLREIMRNPSGFYVNVHNAAFPEGAIRGQLDR